MKALGTLADLTACGYYRMILPYAEMNESTDWDVRTTAEVAGMPEHEMWDGVDLLVMQRVVGKQFLWLVMRGHWTGRPFIVEVDDLLDHLDPTNWMAWDYY